jgi:NAD(P)-dependent dehydrogenase (short-subunit alcohol dehydrogenase family)
LDLADPSSVDQFSENFLGSNLALDVLINNAGIMATPLMRDSSGYEMQFATNHLRHFQLTASVESAQERTEFPSSDVIFFRS